MDRAECPVLFLNNPVDWGIEDPKGKNIERVRIIRDEIERRVIELVKDLEHN
jgi:protein-tyrosine-phosphatase